MQKVREALNDAINLSFLIMLDAPDPYASLAQQAIDKLMTAREQIYQEANHEST